MTARALTGLAPWLPRHRPRARARWWVARGALEGPRVVLTALESLADAEPVPQGRTGLAAPCSLPVAFLEALGVETTTRASSLASLARLTAPRLCAEARRFAKARPRGQRHPRRTESESACALDRTRLPLFLAAVPLLRRHDVFPWAAPEREPCLVEVDVAAWCAASGLPATGLAGDDAGAIGRRAAIADALAVDLADARDLAVASLPALRAVVALAAAAATLRRDPPPVDSTAEAWLALP